MKTEEQDQARPDLLLLYSYLVLDSIVLQLYSCRRRASFWLLLGLRDSESLSLTSVGLRFRLFCDVLPAKRNVHSV